MARRDSRQWSTRGLVMERIRAEVDAIRPGNRSGFFIDADLAKHVDFFQGGKCTTATDNPAAEVNLAVRTVVEVQLENVVPNVAHRCHSRGHCLFPPVT